MLNQEAILLVTQRLPENSLAKELQSDFSELKNAGIETVETIGDCYSPGLILEAVYSGHSAARSFERNADDIERDLFRREMPSLINN